MGRCRWVYDKDVPGGKFLVPGCWNRALDEYGDCHCKEGPETIGDQLAALRSEINNLKRTVAAIRKGAE
jgi:hypothetical protein